PQDVAGRILRYRLRSREAPDLYGAERDAVIIKRTLDMIGIDYQVIFPTPMLGIGLHPEIEVESALARAYAHWVTERLLPENPRLKTLLCLPFNSPQECLRLVDEFGDREGVIGFMITGERYSAVHGNEHAPLFRTLEERG